MKLLSALFLTWLTLPIQIEDGMVSRSGFFGISLNSTTFEEADRILMKQSFKEPDQYFKSILRSDGSTSTLNLPSYFVRIGTSDVKITLKGYSTVGQIHISNLRSGGDVRYKGVILGQTKVSDITFVKDKSWTESKDIDGNTTITIAYQGIKLGVDPNSTEELNDRIVTLFILSKDK